jgi:flagellar basal-body rod protein FlgF
MIASNNGFAVQRPAAIIAATQEAQVIRLQEAARNLTLATTVGAQGFTSKLEQVQQRSIDGRMTSYMRVAGIIRDTSSGPIRTTRNPFDVAITGKGYFKVKAPDGVRYTRDGQFHINENGVLVNSKNHPVLTENDSPGQQFDISSKGLISVDGKSAGQLGIAMFDKADEQKMEPQGYNEFMSKAAPTQSNDYFITQFALEESNISSITESIKLIEINRVWQDAVNALQAYDENLKHTLNVSSK